MEDESITILKSKYINEIKNYLEFISSINIRSDNDLSVLENVRNRLCDLTDNIEEKYKNG